MARLAALLLALAAVSAGCRLDPEGRCDTRADCPDGRDCLNHVCSNCRSDLECWSRTYCSSAGLCEPRDGYCWVDADCETWERCDARYVCVTREDHCPVLPCVAPRTCDPAHHCTLPAGTCVTAEDCPAWMASCSGVAGTPANTCLFSGTAGDDVLAWGTLAEGSCESGVARGAISRATTLAASSTPSVEVGFDCGSGGDGRAYVDPVGGELVYRHAEAAGADTLRRFRPDSLEWDAAASLWRFPEDGSAGDEIVSGVGGACSFPITWGGWIMQAGTGALMYACPYSGVALRDYYDLAGVRKVQAVGELLSWSDGGYLLALSGSGALQVLDPAGVATAVVGLPAGTLHARRATATGFRVALRNEAAVPAPADELWEIDELTAVAAFVGRYAEVSTSYAGQSWEIIDSNGSLYGRAFLSLSDLILKRPLEPGETEAVYDEGDPAADGANDFTAATFKPFVRLHTGSLLVTRP